MDIHEKYMQRCLELSLRGIGNTAPNPMVGCVIVDKGNHIISEAYHQQFGGLHAEALAIEQTENKELLKESRLYVSLEPCAHYGKTPPCADLIIKHGIPEVYIAVRDPFPQVDGKGIEKLRAAGITVITGILEAEAAWLNRRFFTAHNLKRPYIILKWAQSQDGFIDKHRKSGDPCQPNWISGEESRILVHRWRSEEQAILVGNNTVFCDNPELTTRLWPGKSPLRCIIDEEGILAGNLRIFNEAAPTIVYHRKPIAEKIVAPHISYHALTDQCAIRQICDHLLDRGIHSLMVEGGAKTLHTFIDSGLWDEARIFTGQTIFGEGLTAPAITIKKSEEEIVGKDTLAIYLNKTKIK